MTASETMRQMDLLRFATAGSVDDGKSTLIGRLLYDTKTVFEDQIESVERASKDRGDDYVNLALLTDGLRAEREQGITIDVAYRYFQTPHRKFIIADTPGHTAGPAARPEPEPGRITHCTGSRQSIRLRSEAMCTCSRW